MPRPVLTLPSDNPAKRITNLYQCYTLTCFLLHYIIVNKIQNKIHDYKSCLNTILPIHLPLAIKRKKHKAAQKILQEAEY